MAGGDTRPFAELRDSGLLWLINRVVFHPRGFALALVFAQDDTERREPLGWRIQGDGSEVWRFTDDEDDSFARAESTLRSVMQTAESESVY